MVFKRIAAVLLWLLVTLTSAFGFVSSELETASGDFFCGTLEDAGRNDSPSRFLCRINGWLNYDTLSECAVAANKIDIPTTQLEFPFARGASVQTPGVTVAGEKFVRVGASPKNLKFSFDAPGGVQPGTYAFPLETFESIPFNQLKNFGDLPGSPPQYFRIFEPPAGTSIQRGIVPGGEFGGVGGAGEVIFNKGF